MIDLVEKPSPAAARRIEHRHGHANLMLLEGRMRLTGDFVAFARTHPTPPGSEPKWALTLAAYAQHHPVHVVPLYGDVIDLGTPATCTSDKYLYDTAGYGPAAQNSLVVR
jgi:hypothetical protein